MLSHCNRDRRWDKAHRPKKTDTPYCSNGEHVSTHDRRDSCLCRGRWHSRVGLCKAESSSYRATPVFDCDMIWRRAHLLFGATSRIRFDYEFIERIPFPQIVGIYLHILPAGRESEGANGEIVVSEKERAIQIGSSKHLFREFICFLPTSPPVQ